MEYYCRSEEVLVRNGREEVVTRTEIITPSPYKDGYQWRKYGQKNIQDSNYLRWVECSFYFLLVSLEYAWYLSNLNKPQLKPHDS